jgi:hypothetical protein
MDFHIMNVERLPVLRRVACEFEERMLDLGVPFILRHPIHDRPSVQSLPCPVSALSEALNQAPSAAPYSLPKILEPHPIYVQQGGNDRLDIIVSQDSNTICKLLSGPAHRRDVFGLLPFLVVVELAKDGRLFFKVDEQLELFHRAQASTLM